MSLVLFLTACATPEFQAAEHRNAVPWMTATVTSPDGPWKNDFKVYDLWRTSAATSSRWGEGHGGVEFDKDHGAIITASIKFLDPPTSCEFSISILSTGNKDVGDSAYSFDMNTGFPCDTRKLPKPLFSSRVPTANGKWVTLDFVFDVIRPVNPAEKPPG